MALERIGIASLLGGLLLAGCLPAPPAAPESQAPLEIAGVLSGETILSGEVLLVDDVLVPAGSRVVFRAGTTVRVRSAEGTQIDPEYLSSLTELLVRGTLVVQGTEESPVRFLPLTSPSEGEPAWAGILLDRATESAVEGARIEGAETGILCIDSSPLLRGNRITGCRYGIIAQQKSSPRILDNRLEAGEGGIFCWRGSNPYLYGNRIAGNREEGVFVDASSRPWLDRNEVTGNAIGLALYPRDLPFDSTEVRGNGEDIRFLGGGGGAP